VNKEIKKNRYKKKALKINGRMLKQIKRLFCIIVLIPVVMVSMGCIFIFSHDLVTQSNYFSIKEIKIIGLETISEEDILKNADIEKGMNILSINLSLIRKKLLAHPWIGTVDVERVIPSSINIIISEHRAFAIADIGDYFLINEKGQIFKKLASSDPSNLPVITGLELKDIDDYQAGKESYLKSVMDILNLGKKTGSTLSYKKIKHIHVDRELGLSLILDNNMKTVKLGFSDYSKKFDRIKDILICSKKVKQIDEISVIDLSNLNRIVITPAKT